MRTLVWFSCGAASAVAAKLAVEKHGSKCEVLYCDTLSTEHPDNARFFADVERWIGRSITKIRSEKYASIDDVFMRERYMAGVAGAKCTVVMKKWPREAMQRDTDSHVFGYTYEEQRRADRFEENNPILAVEWIRIDQHVTKVECLRRLKAAGIALPEMYALGFEHNNCLGCVKSQSPSYWNKTRALFPEVWARRVEQSRSLGVRLAKVGLEGVADPESAPVTKDGKVVGYRVFLDKVPLDATGPSEDIECGPACQTSWDFMRAQ